MTTAEPGEADRGGDDRTWARAQEILALGGHHRSLLRPLTHGEEDAYPRFAARAEGCRIVDLDGREFIDWVSGSGCALLGYRHPSVEAAIREQLAAGPTLSLYHAVEVEVAEALIEMIPCAEMVAFGKHGSDALTAAVRIARAATGRQVILHHGFHGFHDWFACRYRERPGLPHASAADLHPFPYNDLPALEALLRNFAGSVAAVLMEPTSVEEPDAGYLDGVCALAHAHGALLVFDEVWTGFRLANGGAQERFGVVPDLACYGKPLANGMPLSAVAGRRRYMRLLPSVAYGMTYRDETLSLAACRAVLDVVRAEPVAARIQAVGARVRDHLLRRFQEAGVDCAVAGMDGRLSLEFATQGGIDRDRLLGLFLRECALRGVLTSGLIVPNYAHDDAAVARSLEVFGEAIDVVAAAIDAPRKGAAVDRSALPPLDLTKGHLDVVRLLPDGWLRVEGWLLVDDACAERVEIASLFPDGGHLAVEPAPRPDVAAACGLGASAEACGFSAVLPAAIFARESLWEFEIQAHRDGAAVFRCAIAYRAEWSRPVLCGTAWLTFGV